MKICFVGQEDPAPPVPGFRGRADGGELEQQRLLARALARRGHGVSKVVACPHWTGTWSALARVDADLYYTSCAGVQVGLLALFCASHGKRFVCCAAGNPGCERPSRLSAFGLRRAGAILVHSGAQAQALARDYGLPSRLAGVLVEAAPQAARRDIDILWVGDLRGRTRPDRVLALARRLPGARVHMVGGSVPGEEVLFREMLRMAVGVGNLSFHGPLPCRETNSLCAQAKLLVDTSEAEQLPDSYLQAWARGVPAVTLADPDGVIAREGLGIVASSPRRQIDTVSGLLGDPAAWQAASTRCKEFMAREHGEDRVLRTYLETFHQALRGGVPARGAPRERLHA